MEFYSNGKLFILGEYYVLEGAKVFALPTRFGQYLKVFPIKSAVVSWKSYDADGTVWYNDDISVEDIIRNNKVKGDKIRSTLTEILHEAHLLNARILDKGGFIVETELTFPRNWGLGTSSTLINNIAQWFEIDAFTLLHRSFGGSGYDIACAQHNTPVTYQLNSGMPVVEEVIFNPQFKDNIWFVYLNQKRDSKEAIANFKKKRKNLTEEVIEVSRLTDEVLLINDLEWFITFFKKYEQNLAKVLEMKPVQEHLFPDFSGLVKSLGGWGGDFVMVASLEDPSAYFKKKGYTTIVPYKQMIL